MSLILDALKKLEREKAACRKGPVDIVPEIISSRNRRERTGNWRIPAVIISVVAATAAATTLIVIALATPKKKPVPAASVTTENVRPFPRFSAMGEQADAKSITEDNIGHDTQGAIKVPPARRSTVSTVENTQNRLPSHESKPAIEKTDDAAIGSGGTSTDLKVSGIAWQDDRAERRAVVNGALVGEGTVVEGARIVRILQDRVRFSRAGEMFEIAVTGSSQLK